MKTCFKCRQTKPLSEFYAHPKMADGRLNKCKECNKKDSQDRIAKVKQDPKWIMLERDRSRKKTLKARANGTFKQGSNEVKRRWDHKNKHKTRAEQIARLAKQSGELKEPPVCDRCRLPGLRLVMHHPDYSRPKFVMWLCDPCHGFVHRKPEPIAP